MPDKTPPESTTEAPTDDNRVVSIFDRRPVETTLDEAQDQLERDAAVRTLEEILEDLKSGEITGFAIVMAHNDQCMGSVCSPSASTSPFRYIGALERMKYRMLRELDEFLEYDDED